MTVTSARFETPGCSSDGCDADAEYAIRYRAKDSSGVSRAEFVKEGDVRETVTPTGRAQNLGGRVVFTTGFLESGADAITGTTVDIEATDTHGAATRQTALERQNFYGNLAGELDHENVYTVAAASELARVSGFASSYGAPVRGAKQSAEGVPAFLRTLSEDPLAVLEGITEILRVLEKYGILDTLVEAFAGPLQEKQETNNPYSESETPELYRAYKISWYQGYAGGKATQVVLGAGAAKAVTKSAKVRKLDDSLSGQSNSYRALRSVKQRKDAAEAVAATKVLRGTARVGSGALRGVWTVGSKVKVWRVSAKADLDTNDLSDAEQQAVGRFVVREGDDGARVLADGGEDTVDIIRRYDGVDEQTAERLTTLRDAGELTQSDLRLLENSLDRGNIDAGDLRRISKLLSESNGLRDDDISVAVLVDIAERGDFSDTLGIVAPNDVIIKNGYSVDTVRLHVGNKNKGRTHYVLRHVAGAERRGEGITSIWPMGQSIGGRTMADLVDYEDITRLVYTTIKYGEANDKGTSVNLYTMMSV